MNNHDVTKQQTGAMAAIGALRNIERIQENAVSADMTMDDYWKYRDMAVDAMHQASGNQDAFVTGFIGVLAEYIASVLDAGIPDLDKWKPEAAMSQAEKIAERARFTEFVEQEQVVASAA